MAGADCSISLTMSAPQIVKDRIRDRYGNQTAFAREMDVTKAAVSMWMSSGIPPGRVGKVAFALGLTPHDVSPEGFPKAA